MGLLAQQGYGKSDKIETGIRDGSLDGVILSPRDMSPANLQSYIDDLRNEFGDAPEIMVDPQFFASVVPDATDRNLPDYPFYDSGLRRADFLSARAVSRYVRNAVDFQRELDVDFVLSPTIAFDNFSDVANQTALQLGAESAENKDRVSSDQQLLITFNLSEAALSDLDGINEFLDITTSWDIDGFYVVVEPQDTTYPATLGTDRLTNLMYMIYSWAELNELKVLLGYSDFTGLILRSAGAESQATGWFSGLRHFSRSRWQPSSGGRAPRPRYSSTPLLNSILKIPELSAAYQVGMVDDCLSDSIYDADFFSQNPADVDWPMNIQCLHHWSTLSSLADDIVGNNVSSNLERLSQSINVAGSIYGRLLDAGVQFDRLSGPNHLASWSQAIDGFASMVRL